METLYQQMLQRYETLLHKEVEIAGQYKELDLAKGQVQFEIEGAKKYLQTGFRDPVIKTEFQKISQLKKELTSNGKPARIVGENKTHVIIRLLQQHGQQGLEMDEILTLLAADNVKMDRGYVTTILGKLKNTRGMVIKQGNKFFLTQPGKNAKIATNATIQEQ